MCMWVFDLARIDSFRENYGLSNLVILGNCLHSRVWSLRNQRLLQFSMDLFEYLHTCCGHDENVHVDFRWSRINFERITAF